MYSKKNIAVFFGGKSSEHDISIITAVQAINALNPVKYTYYPVYMRQDGKWVTARDMHKLETFRRPIRRAKEVFLKPEDSFLYSGKGKKIARLDAALLCNHGLNGEDGTLQGLLELSNIPYTSGGVLASGAGMDKIIMKQLFKEAGLKILPFAYLDKSDFEHDLYAKVKAVVKKLDFPIIIKPANLGSSIGIRLAHNTGELIEGIRLALYYDRRVLLEKALTDFTEVNCSALGIWDEVQTSVIEQPLSWKEFLSFDEKYGGGKAKGMGGQKRRMPAEIPEKTAKKVKDYTLKAFRALSCKGVARVDFMIDNLSGELYINEINTIPGSLSFYLWEHEGITFPELLDRLISIALVDWAGKNSLTYCYKSEVLSGKCGKE